MVIAARRNDEYDAVIVGGGIGGVAAARRLLEAGKRVCLLEAQDRWGGRTKLARSSAVPGVTVDVGGQWVGPTHTRLLELLRTLGLPLVRQYGRGADLLDDGQQIRKSLNLGTNIPRVSMLALLEVQFIIVGKLERLARRMPASDVLLRDGSGAAARRLAALDATSCEAWLRERCWTRDAVRLGALTVEMLLGVEPAQLSLLSLLQYIRANGSLSFLVEVENAAQQWWVGGGGMGRVAPLLVETLRREHGSRLDARLGSPVRRVEKLDGGRLGVCLGSGEALVAAHVLLALPPTACLERIELRPAPPPEWQRCAARAFMGCYTKCVVLYDAPFWRERGLSGTCMRLAWDAEHPVQNIYDHSEGEP